MSKWLDCALFFDKGILLFNGLWKLGRAVVSLEYLQRLRGGRQQRGEHRLRDLQRLLQHQGEGALVICPSNHSACKECVDAMAGKEHTKCPFCRCDLALTGLRQNEFLMGKLSVYENEEKKLARKTPSSLSREELLDWTLEEAKKHGYSDIVTMILSRSKRPLEGVKEINMLYINLTTPIDLSIFPNVEKLEFCIYVLKQIKISLR